MHCTIRIILPAVLLAAAQPALAAPAAKAALRLTPIEDTFSGSACRISLRQNDQLPLKLQAAA